MTRSNSVKLSTSIQVKMRVQGASPPVQDQYFRTLISWACCNLSVGVALNMWFTTNGMCAKNNTHIYVARTSNDRVIAAHDLYCCLLPQCEALRTCCSGFPIATKWFCDQDMEVVPCETFTKTTCNRCCSLWTGGDVVATSPLALR